MDNFEDWWIGWFLSFVDVCRGCCVNVMISDGVSLVGDRSDFRVFRKSSLLIVGVYHENACRVVGYVEQGVRNECEFRAVISHEFE